MTAVWDHAHGVSGGPLLVLLALADFANDDGTGAYPKQATLATKTRLSERHVRRVLAQLEDKCYIERMGRTPGGVVEWRVENTPDILSARTPVADEPGHGGPTEPSREPSDESNDSSEASEVENGDAPPSKPGRYSEPETPGSAAAPWLVLELGRLVRKNDPGAKLPVGLRDADLDTGTTVGRDSRTPEEAKSKMFAAARERFDVEHASVKGWLDSMRLLIDADKRDGREVVQVLRWCQGDDFWKTNILSADKFRKQYPKLRLRWLEEGGGAGRPSNGTRPPDRGPATAAQLDAMARRA